MGSADGAHDSWSPVFSFHPPPLYRRPDLRHHHLEHHLSPSRAFPIMAAEPESAVRQRKAVADPADPAAQDAQPSNDEGGKKKRSKKSKKVDTDEVEYGNPLVDVLRVLSFLLFVSCGASYLVSGGESFFWSLKVPPKYLRVETWKGLFVRTPTRLRPRCSMPLSSLTDHSCLLLEWAPVHNPRRTRPARRFRRNQAHLPCHQWLRIRCHRRLACLWTRRLLPRLCRRRCLPRLRHWLFRRGPHT